MKIKDGFILQTVGDENVVVPIGKASTGLNGIIRLNGSGVLLWNLLAAGADEQQLIRGLTEEYGISDETAGRDISAFLAVLAKAGCLEK